MRTKKGFVLRDICGEKVLSAEGAEVIEFTSLVRLNESSAYLWQIIDGKEFTCEDMANALCERYEVDYETALKDCKAFVSSLAQIGIVEE